MLKRILIVTMLALLVTLTAVASDREDDVNRTNKAAQVFREIMNTPDQGIPSDLLNSANVLPSFQGTSSSLLYSAGTMAGDWQPVAPGMAGALPVVAIQAECGYQIGGSSTDIVMLFMNDHALQSLLSDKFKLGGDPL